MRQINMSVWTVYNGSALELACIYIDIYSTDIAYTYIYLSSSLLQAQTILDTQWNNAVIFPWRRRQRRQRQRWRWRRSWQRQIAHTTRRAVHLCANTCRNSIDAAPRRSALRRVRNAASASGSELLRMAAKMATPATPATAGSPSAQTEREREQAHERGPLLKCNAVWVCRHEGNAFHCATFVCRPAGATNCACNRLHLPVCVCVSLSMCVCVPVFASVCGCVQPTNCDTVALAALPPHTASKKYSHDNSCNGRHFVCAKRNKKATKKATKTEKKNKTQMKLGQFAGFSTVVCCALLHCVCASVCEWVCECVSVSATVCVCECCSNRAVISTDCKLLSGLFGWKVFISMQMKSKCNADNSQHCRTLQLCGKFAANVCHSRLVA